MIISDLNEPWGESETCTSCGKCLLSCPTGALFQKGATAGESERDRTRLEFIVTARERKNNGASKNSHSLARRLRRLPHVLPRP